MALKKTITERNGVQTEYHKINKLEIGSKFIKRNRVKVGEEVTFEEVEVYAVTLVLASYLNAELRQKSHGLSVKETEYRFTIPAADVEARPLFELAYAELKKLEAFEGAEDC